MKFVLFLFVFVFSALGRAEPVKTVGIYISNHGGSGPQENFRALIYINGSFVRNYLATPGTKRTSGRYTETPSGDFHPTKLKEMHNSSQSDSSIFWSGDPMPHSIFFKGGFAIHGSYGTVDGRKGSHGCVRLHPEDARELFSFVSEAVRVGGLKSVSIYIRGTQSQ